MAHSELNELLEHVRDGYAPNTLRAYRADMEEFIAYCASNDQSALPADPFVIADFLMQASQSGVKSSTIRRKVASISAIHRLSYLEDPTKHPEVKIAIRKINRKLGTRFKQAHPINRDLLDQMLNVCGDDLRGKRNKMLLLLAYESLKRRSELVSLRVEDIRFNNDGTSTILLRCSKTDQTAEGSHIYLGQTTTVSIKDWLGDTQLKSSYLLRGIKGNKLTDGFDTGQVCRTFKRLAKLCGIDPNVAKRISGHSTRVGAAQDLLQSGNSLAQIMAKVGWAKVDTVIRYVGLTPMQGLTLDRRPA